MKFLLPQGLGDSVWALHKIQAVADRMGDGKVEVYLSGETAHQIESRALDFVRRFSFVSHAEMRPFDIHTHPRISPEGFYNYLPDGLYKFHDGTYCALMPNSPLERGIRLEAWLPQYPIDWNIFDHFQITPPERLVAETLQSKLGEYVVFYPGPLNGNTRDGHNRGPLWKPEDWRELGREIYSTYNLPIVVVGAPYDLAYYEQMLEPLFDDDEARYWHSVIGQTNIGELYSITSEAEFVISYQAGVGIVSTYLSTPTGIFWRPKGDSISPSKYLSFAESMASAWVPPKLIADGTHLPLIYKRHGVAEIMADIKSRGWVR